MIVKVSTATAKQEPNQTSITPGLGLFIPGIRRMIRLNRQSISFGSSKFRDLDLSELPGGEAAAPHQGDFFFRDGNWMVQANQTQGSILLNGEALGNEAVTVKWGDCLELEGGIKLLVRGCGAPGVSSGLELETDFVLMFQSVSMTNGHIGIQIRYDAARRMLVREDWGVVGGKKLDKGPEECPVPENITTREEVYALANRQSWEHCELPERMYDQDVLLWLSKEAQVQYVAEKREVLYQKWVADETSEPVLREHWCRFANTCGTEQAVREYACRCWPHFPNNRKGELDNDLTLSMPMDENELVYYAERREVVCTQQRMWRSQEGKTESIPVPEHIRTKNELNWYLKIHKLEWMPRYARNDDMIKDGIIAKGVRRQGLRRIHWQTQYRAADRTVVHVADLTKPNEISEPLKIPFDVFAMQFLPDYVKKNRPDWM